MSFRYSLWLVHSVSISEIIKLRGNLKKKERGSGRIAALCLTTLLCCEAHSSCEVLESWESSPSRSSAFLLHVLRGHSGHRITLQSIPYALLSQTVH